MKLVRETFSRALITIRVGFFLAVREIRRANIWTSILIIAVMVLTFLNLVVVSGVLVGLIQGSEDAYRDHYLGDVTISKLTTKKHIERTSDILSFVKSLPEVTSIAVRYTQPVRLEANYKTRLKETDLINSAGGVIAGIDPAAEDQLGNLSKFIIEGRYLDANDYDKVMIGANMLYKYNPVDSADMPSLKDVDVGSKIRVVVGDVKREMTVIGVLKTKIGEIDQRVFIPSSQLRAIVNQSDFNAGEIAIRIDPRVTPEYVRDLIVNSGANEFATVQTSEDALPKFVRDIKSTFATLGNLISSIGLAVAAITIFIVVFVNAITRRRYIGILKGIGISSVAIEISYIIQSLFYAVVGMLIGTVIVFGILVPYITANPIDFPFSNGILVATPVGTAIRALILCLATIIAGYIPARIVVKQNTLNAILGR